MKINKIYWILGLFIILENSGQAFTPKEVKYIFKNGTITHTTAPLNEKMVVTQFKLDNINKEQEPQEVTQIEYSLEDGTYKGSHKEENNPVGELDAGDVLSLFGKAKAKIKLYRDLYKIKPELAKELMI